MILFAHAIFVLGVAGTIPPNHRTIRREEARLSHEGTGFIMRIHFERSGGFAGLRLQHDLDTTSLPSAEAEEVARMVDSAHFFELPQAIRTTQPGADRFRYKLSVDSGAQTHSIEVDDAAMPDNLRPLLSWLTAAQRKK